VSLVTVPALQVTVVVVATQVMVDIPVRPWTITTTGADLLGGTRLAATITGAVHHLLATTTPATILATIATHRPVAEEVLLLSTIILHRAAM
jgi:hypothetical protein